MAEVRAGPPDGRRLLPDASRDLAHHLVPAARYRAWVALGPDPWVVSTMTRGHRLQFARTPALTRSWVVTSVADPHHRVVLRAEVSTLLAKKAIRVVGPEDQRVRPDYMTGHRGSTLSSSRGHGLPAQHYFRRLCPEI